MPARNVTSYAHDIPCNKTLRMGVDNINSHAIHSIWQFNGTEMAFSTHLVTVIVLLYTRVLAQEPGKYLGKNVP